MHANQCIAHDELSTHVSMQSTANNAKTQIHTVKITILIKVRTQFTLCTLQQFYILTNTQLEVLGEHKPPPRQAIQHTFQ